MNGILRDSLAELLDRKIVWVYAAFTVVGILIVIAANSASVQFQGQGMDIRTMNDELGNPVMRGINTFAYVLVFLSVLASAGIFPRMMVRGRADYFLAMPISRGSLLINKLLSVWVVYSLLVAVSVVIIWLVTGAVLGVFGSGLSTLLVLQLLSLLVWLNITVTVGVVTNSNAMSIMAAFVVWVLQKVLAWHEEIRSFIDSKVVQNLVTGLYYIVPKTAEISDQAQAATAGRPIDWMPLYSSLLFAVVMAGVAVYVFRRKNY